MPLHQVVGKAEGLDKEFRRELVGGVSLRIEKLLAGRAGR